MRYILAILVLMMPTAGMAVTNNSVPGPPVMICNPDSPSNCIKPNADGSINTSGGGGGGTVTQGTPGSQGWLVTGGPVTITQTETIVPPTTSTPITTLTSRKFLSMTNDGVNPCRVSYGVAATATNGEPLAGAAAAYGQGGARTFDASAIPQVTVYAYCTLASSFAVLEGQ